MEEDDRRKDERIGRDAEVFVRVLSFPLGSSDTVKVEMNDVSGGGVGLLSPEPVDVGASVEVSITLPGWFRHTSAVGRFRDELKPLTAVGRVVRSEPVKGGGFELGVEFTDIWEEHWNAMRTYLKELTGC